MSKTQGISKAFVKNYFTVVYSAKIKGEKNLKYGGVSKAFINKIYFNFRGANLIGGRITNKVIHLIIFLTSNSSILYIYKLNFRILEKYFYYSKFN